jgi:hypothetical protein
MTSRRARSLAFALFASIGACAADGDAGASRTITRFAYHAAWGPCRPDLEPCQEDLVATPDGAVTYTRTETRSSTLTPADASDFARFLEDPALAAAISDATPCPPISDNWRTVTLERAGGQAPLVKDIAGCQGATYDAIDAWITRARAYFPQ